MAEVRGHARGDGGDGDKPGCLADCGDDGRDGAIDGVVIENDLPQMRAAGFDVGQGQTPCSAMTAATKIIANTITQKKDE